MAITKFSSTLGLPDYLEEALAPFSWSGVLSDRFRDNVVSCIVAHNRELVTGEFVAALYRLRFLDREWVEELSYALTRFAKEGFTSATTKEEKDVVK